MSDFTGSDGTRDLLLQLYGGTLAGAAAAATATATDVVDHADVDMSSEWLDDDDMWAATALAAAAAAAPCPLGPAQERAAVAPPSRTPPPAVADQQGPMTACKNAQGPRGGSCTSIAIGILESMRRCGNSPLCLMGSHEQQQQQQQQRRQSSSSSSSSWSHYPSTTTSPITKTTTGDDSVAATCSVDSVLSAAREAAELARRLLDCPTCRAGPQLQLLLAVAFAEIIAGYRRVISSYHGGEELKQQQRHHHRTNDELRRAPLSIGSHQIEDVMMEAALVGRVVGSRLRELEAVMGEILRPPSPRTAVAAQSEFGWWSGVEAAGGSSSSSSSSDLSVLLRGLHLGRDSFLATQLDTARHELMGLLMLHQETTADLLPGP